MGDELGVTDKAGFGPLRDKLRERVDRRLRHLEARGLQDYSIDDIQDFVLDVMAALRGANVASEDLSPYEAPFISNLGQAMTTLEKMQDYLDSFTVYGRRSE